MSPAVERVLRALEAHGCNPRPNGKGWEFRCPCHEDRKASGSLAEGEEGRALLRCHAGCPVELIVAALGLTMADLFPARPKSRRGRGGRITPSVTPQQCNARPPDHGEASATGCTLASYAIAKGLPIDFLRSLGLSDLTYQGVPAVRIPYRNEQGEEVAVRFRLALEGAERFRWRRGDKPCLYGLHRLEEARAKGYTVLVEGESDGHTLWFQGEPALGLPGAASWREEWAHHLDGIPTIYGVIEPDKGGETVTERLGRSAIRDRVRLVRLDGFKDPSALHIHDPASFTERWRQAIEAAEPLRDIIARREQEQRSADWSACRDLASEPDILAVFHRDLERAGLVGEHKNVRLLYLDLTTRLLDRPVSIIVKGPSSSGKSYLVQEVLRFFPEEAAYILSGMSERALAYSQEPLAHRFLVVYEWTGLSGDFASYLVRSLLSEGRIRYETVEKTKDGLVPRLIEREGPTGLIVTTTEIKIHPENETRMLSVTVRDDPEQTAAILDVRADEAENTPQVQDFSRWHALQRWLAAGETKVSVPFARLLAKNIAPVAVRLRRDFPAILTLIKAHAFLHQVNRQRDSRGRILAILGDYAAVRELALDVLGNAVEVTVPASVRETVVAVEAIPGEVSNTALAQRLGLDPSTVSRRVRQALERHFLRNLEERKGRPARLVVGDPMPEDRELLPRPEALQCCTVEQGDTDPPSPLFGDAPAEDEALQEGIATPGMRPIRPCPACRGTSFWRSIHGVVTCAGCHPPATPQIVAQWLGL